MRYAKLSVSELLVNSINGFPFPAGLGMGKPVYLVPEDSATSYFRGWLIKNGAKPSDIYATLATAYAGIKAYRNDVIFVFPGEYVSTSQLTWDKSQAHLFGLAGPNVAFQPSTLTAGGVRLSAVTTGVSSIIDFTGDFIQVYGIGTQNTYSVNTNLGDIKISGRNFYAKHCDFRGGQGTNQLNDNAGAPIWIPAIAGAGNGMKIVECKIGSSGNATRTAGAGCVYSIGGIAGMFSMEFQKCIFSMRAQHVTPSAFVFASQGSADRYILLDDCLLYNFSENHGTIPAYVIRDNDGGTHDVCIKNSMMRGFTAWCNTTVMCFTNMANAESEGGRSIAVAVT